MFNISLDFQALFKIYFQSALPFLHKVLVTIPDIIDQIVIAHFS
jgi:hypothetical protein